MQRTQRDCDFCVPRGVWSKLMIEMNGDYFYPTVLSEFTNMKTADALRMTLDASAKVLTAYLADFSDADMFVRPHTGANHTAWQFGHLIASERSMMEAVKAGSSPALPAGFSEAHKKETATSNEQSKFFTRKVYLDLFMAQRAATLHLLETMSDSDFDKASPADFKNWAPTFGAMFSGAGTHVLMHVGQVAIVRRILNKPIVI